MKETRASDFYSHREELANILTHLPGIPLSIIGLVLLILLGIRNDSATEITSFSIFGVSLTLLYLSSTLYHITRKPERKAFFRKLDHSAIYCVIAGTYTPFLLVGLKGTLGWWMFGLIWTLAISGVLYKMFYLGKHNKISLYTYIGMGWIAIIVIRQLIASVPPDALYWLLAGGAAYTGGTVFFSMRKLPYNHAVWHLFVAAGSLCHFFAVQGLV